MLKLSLNITILSSLDSNPPRKPKIYDNYSTKREMKEKTIQKLNTVYQEPSNFLKICIDCSFSDKMSPKETSRLAHQIGRCYATNKSIESPVHLTLCNLDQNSAFYKELCRVNDGFDDYIIDKTDLTLDEKFKDKKEKLCYLSPDADNFLEDVSADKI